MAFQTYRSESLRMPLLEELKGETVLSLAQRSPKQLSELCVARGLNTQGTVHEIAARLVDWKKAVGYGPAPATPTLHDAEFDSSFDPRTHWPEDEESIIGLGHLRLASPSGPGEISLVNDSELSKASIPSNYYSTAAQVDTRAEEVLNFKKLQSPHPKRGASPRQSPHLKPNVVYPRPPNVPIPPPRPVGFPRKEADQFHPPNGINSPHQGPFPKTPHPCPIRRDGETINRSPINPHPLHFVNQNMSPQVKLPQANQHANQAMNPQVKLQIDPINRQPKIQPNHAVNRQPSPHQQTKASGETLFKSLLAVQSSPLEPSTMNPAPSIGSFVGIEDAICLEPITVATDWANTPEPSPKQYDPTKPLAKDQIEDFLLRGPGQGLVQIKFSDLEFGRKLGSGGYKECYAGTFKGEPVAIGELKVTEFTPADFHEIKNEIDVLKQLWHENVVRFIGITKGPSKLSIVTELCHRGDLYDHMRKTPKPPLQRQLGLMHDISLGVSYLHTRRPSIIHRDLKSMNILLNDEYKAKINDFGLARIRTRVKSLAHTQCGTPNWQAPEIWEKKPSYTEKVDVYAVGLIFWEIMQWSVEPYPFWNVPENDLVAEVGGKGLRPSLQNLGGYPQELINLVVRMWDHDPKKRPSMGVVIEELAQYLD